MARAQGKARFGNWKRACYKFLLEQDEPVDTYELTQRVVTRAGTAWQNGAPTVRQMSQLLKADDRFVYMGKVKTKNVQGSTSWRATFLARKVKKDEE